MTAIRLTCEQAQAICALVEGARRNDGVFLGRHLVGPLRDLLVTLLPSGEDPDAARLGAEEVAS